MKFNLLTEKQKAVNYLNRLIEKECRIELKEIKKKRSLDQNKLYWMWMTVIEKETGNEKEYLHEYFKAEYLFDENDIENVFGKFIYKSKSTTKLNTKAMTEYLRKIEIFCNTELNIILPRPEDLGFEELFEKYQ